MTAKGPSVSNSEEVEVLASRKALEFAVDSGFVELIMEGDNATVMQTIACSQATLSHLGHLYGDIQCLSSGLRVVFVSCVCVVLPNLWLTLWLNLLEELRMRLYGWRNPPH